MIITKAKLTKIAKMHRVWKLIFHIQALDGNDNECLQMLQSIKTDGFLTFSPDKLKAEVEAIMKNRKIGVNEEGKSKSELLRGRIYELWLKGYKSGTFESFYESKMDFFITGVQQIIDTIEIDRLDDYYTTKNLQR